MNYRLGRKAAWAVVLVCALASLTLCIGCKEAPIPMSLSVDTSDAVTTYRVGSTLDTDRIVAKLRMNDGTDKPVDARELHYTCDLNHTGYQEVTASYKGLSDRFMVLVEAENGSLDLATGPWDLMVAAEGDMLRSYRVTAMYTDRQGSPTLVSGISPEVHMYLDGKVVEDGYELNAEDDGKLFTVEYKGVHTRGRTLTVLPLLPATGMKVRTVDSRDREYRPGETFRYPSNLWVDISYEGSGETRTVNLVDDGGNATEGVAFLIDGTEVSPDGYEFAESQGGTTVPVTVRYEKVKAGTVRPVLERVLVPFEDSPYLECSYDVAVKEAATVQSIAIAKNPDRMSYAGTGEDAKLDLRGLEVTAYMSDGTTKHVEWESDNAHGITTVPANGAGVTKDQDVKVTYGGKETTYKVTYTKDRELSSIKVLTKPDKTDYDKGEAFTAEGLSVRATYDDGSWNIVRYEDETGKFSFSPISVGTDVTENKTITVTYIEGGKSPTATFPITYQKPRKVTGIEIVNKDQYQVTLTVGDTYRAPASVLVTVTYDDGSDEVKQLPVTDRTDTNEAKDYKTTVSYTDPNYPAEIPCTDSYTVTVKEAATVYSIKVLSKPSKTNYGSGDTFSAEGLIIRATYTDGKQRTVVYDGSNMTFTGKDGRTLDNRTEITADETVTVIYGEQDTTFGIMYKAPRKVTGITIVNKSQYEKTVTVNDGTYQKPSIVPVTVYYDDGTSEVKDGTVGTVDISTVGEKTVEVTYKDPNDNNTEYKDTYTVTVKELATVKAISVAAPPDKVSYSGTEKILDLTGLKVLVVMSDGKTKQVEWSIDNANGITTVPANGTDMSAYQDVTVKYTEGSVTKGTTFPVTYKAPKKVTRIEIIDKYKYAVTLTVGTAYMPPTDMAVRVFYDDGTTEVKSQGDISISGTVSTSVDGLNTRVVTYVDSDGTSYTDTYTVTVVKAATVKSISVTRKPDKMSYTGTNAEAKLVLSGLEITAYMSDGTSKLVKYPAEGLAAALDGNTTTVSKDNRTVTVTYGGQTTSFTVSYTPERKLESIVLLTPPDKTNYKPHEKFTAEGLALLATYDDGSQNIIRYSSDDSGFSFTSGSDPFQIGTDVAEDKTILVTYGNQTVGSFGITYNAPKKVTSIQILDKYKYEETLTIGAPYYKPSYMEIMVFYDDGTSDVKDTTDSNMKINVREPFDTSQEKQVSISVSYSDPNYLGASRSDNYIVKVVMPTIGDVGISSVELVQGTALKQATSKTPVNLDDMAYKVTFSSDVKGATYYYQYGTAQNMKDGYITADSYQYDVSVDIPANQAYQKVCLTKVTKDNYKDYNSNVIMEQLIPPGTVLMTLDQGTDNTDWKLSLSSTAGTKIQYRRNNGGWIDYSWGEFEIFDSSVPDGVSVVVIQARALDDQGRQVTNTCEVKYERVSVRFEYGYMNGLEPDLPYTVENKVFGRYPTITAIAPERCEISAILEENLSLGDDSEQTSYHEYPSKKSVLKFIATWDKAKTTVRAYAIDPTGERMNWSDEHYYSSDPVTWEYYDNDNYSEKKIGALGGVIVDESRDGAWYMETIVPERLKEPNTLVCENTWQGSYTIQELVDLEHSCNEDNRCQLWTLTHPFGEDGPVNLVSGMSPSIYGSSIDDYSDWLELCKKLIEDVGESPSIVVPYNPNTLKFNSPYIDFKGLTSNQYSVLHLEQTSVQPLVGKSSSNINMICLFNYIGSSYFD